MACKGRSLLKGIEGVDAVGKSEVRRIVRLVRVRYDISTFGLATRLPRRALRTRSFLRSFIKFVDSQVNSL